MLLRQRQADGSWSLPGDLIERIEACGLMIPVGYWVMEEACRQLAAWQNQGIMLPLSVNVSLLQLLHHDRGEEMLACSHAIASRRVRWFWRSPKAGG